MSCTHRQTHTHGRTHSPALQWMAGLGVISKHELNCRVFGATRRQDIARLETIEILSLDDETTQFLEDTQIAFCWDLFFLTKLLQCQYKKWYNFLFNAKSVWVVQALWEKTSDPQTNTAWFNPDQCLQGINKCRCGPQTNTAWFHPNWCPWAKTDVGWREWTCCRGNTAPQRWIMPTHVCLYCT